MSDPLHPPLTDFAFTAEEEEAVKFALTTSKPWKHEHDDLKGVRAVLVALKHRIRSFHLKRQSSKCCYCRMNLHGGGSFIVDREHIVPKEKYRDLTYVISNLSVACKRCNMQLKKDDVEFLVSRDTILTKHGSSDQYRFIHPNFDKYSQFIKKISYEEDDQTYVKYTKSDHPKAEYTYSYFDLRALEVNSFDQGQGIDTSSVTNLIRERLDQLVSQLG